MKLIKLLQELNISIDDYPNACRIDIKGIKSNSKFVEQGDLFVAINGYEVDGHGFIKDAVDSGAVAILGESDYQSTEIPYIRVKDSRKTLAKLVSCFYGYPYKKHIMIGITGTNGKTTTAYMLKHILELQGKTCSLIGTVNTIINNEVIQSKNTTPDSIELNQLIAKSDDDVVIMEVSSHGIEQNRIEGIYFDFAIFTNLSHDHMDYHKDMWDYFQVKARLFNQLKPTGQAIIATYTDWGKKLADKLTTSKTLLFTIGIGENSLIVEEILPSYFSEFKYNIDGNSYRIKCTTPGVHNGWNMMTAILTCNRMGYNIDSIHNSLQSFSGVPGRFETFTHHNGASFVIDYAHTADAIKYCLEIAEREHAEQIIHVLGFRGKRDVTKRDAMIDSSKEFSHLIILTLDDLNGEEEKDMICSLNELKERFLDYPIVVIPDRTQAISFAWRKVNGTKDWVFITGKGPERYEQVYELPCSSDKETIMYLLSKANHNKCILP
ncbi:UDP-N-acetylmuramoyl-L-alanyl-D-glutamate--2,6-diaminopimelate ligase [Fictibacillus nanhaiensis]|uniref:UDP-N-acetylmuramoyl-L-alanyl-D-glutamate--2, 6-diaminopimelate ligase n=1 Tax=Fictibacillus nanhaiensis TaxID=742169 RepID=UPI00203ED55F|nr:UDP-N-acetylmuramoyl-L-alanyl-D-glutamate--2,6-diaminopimelate ligase [Fictibacillus nanhaiensis]MCM3731155.1 UDP-N-acetylmuramoyl-L-alanyl-D-glutamate--2,6-diaminopimelate ligase [Fictibacillus nanhaiensis]